MEYTYKFIREWFMKNSKKAFSAEDIELLKKIANKKQCD